MGNEVAHGTKSLWFNDQSINECDQWHLKERAAHPCIECRSGEALRRVERREVSERRTPTGFAEFCLSSFVGQEQILGLTKHREPIVEVGSDRWRFLIEARRGIEGSRDTCLRQSGESFRLRLEMSR